MDYGTFIDANLLGALLTAREVERQATIDNEYQRLLNERRQSDVTGRWKGFDDQGFGKVEYRGEIYHCVVLAHTCRQFNAPVNLRRTNAAIRWLAVT